METFEKVKGNKLKNWNIVTDKIENVYFKNALDSSSWTTAEGPQNIRSIGDVTNKSNHLSLILFQSSGMSFDLRLFLAILKRAPLMIYV